MGAACFRCLGDETRWHSYSCENWEPETQEDKEALARLFATAKAEEASGE